MTKAFALLAALAVSLTPAACGGSDEATPAETLTATTQAPQTGATPVTAAATTAAEPATTEAADQGETATTEAADQAETEAPGEAPVVVSVEGGQPVGGVQTITVTSGDRVRFTVRADAPEEVHVHGYDLTKDVGPGKDARFAFPADIEGIFEVELENSAVQIVELVVEP